MKRLLAFGSWLLASQKPTARSQQRLVAIVLALSACGGDRQPVEVGKPAPPYSAVTLAGDSVSLEGQKGSVVLLNVWATWCHPCRYEIPELEAMHAKYKARGLRIVGVTVDAAGAREDISAFLREFKMT